jgi:peptidyl-prolyl cis-trans isomerase D
MLDFIRRSTQGGFGKVLMALSMGLLIVSFGIWGIGDIFRGRAGDGSVARVGSERISAYELQQAFQRELNVLRRQMGQELTAEQARSFGFDRRALSELITAKLFDLAARDLGIGVPDSLLVRDIQGIQAFKDEAGKFDKTRFRQALQSMDYDEASFLAAFRSDVARKQLIDAMLGGLPVPDAIAAPLESFTAERRSVRYVILPAEQAGTLPPVTDEEIKTRYEAAKSGYMTPEYRRFTFVDISPEAIARTIAVTDAEARARFDEHKNDYVKPEKRELQQLLFGSEADARAAADALKGAKSFEDLAKSQGKTVADVSLGEETKADLAPKIADAAFAAPEGGIAGPVEGPFGWALLRVTKIVPAETKSFDDLKAKISADIAKEKAADKAREIATAFEDSRASGAPIEEAAKAKGLAPVTIPAADADGKDPSGNPVPALDGKGTILAEAFKSSTGGDPELKDAPDGGYFVVRVDSVTPPAARPLEAVKDEIRKTLEAEKRRAALAKLAQELAAKGKAGTTIDAIAGSTGQAARTGGPLTRASEDDTFSRQAVQTIFAAKSGDFVSAPVKNGSGYLLIQVGSIEKPTPQEIAAALPKIKPQIGDMLANELATNYADELQARYRVSVTESAVQSALGGS